eukprot:GHVL01000772.1.p1 GENE.GHVL01000772.1~~GHVL01000772.1.p1  ORF type:complete len:448 (+),score=64.12 GHVL01000772.1:46-1344(+)
MRKELIIFLFFICHLCHGAQPQKVHDCDHVRSIELVASDQKVYRYDLSALSLGAAPDLVCRELDRFTYVLNACVNTHLTCNGKESLISQFNPKSTQCVAVLAIGDHIGWDLIDPREPRKGIKIEHINGDYCNVDGQARRAVVSIECETANISRFYFCREPVTCYYDLRVKSPHGCPVAVTTAAKGGTMLNNQLLTAAQSLRHDQLAPLSKNFLPVPQLPPGFNDINGPVKQRIQYPTAGGGVNPPGGGVNSPGGGIPGGLPGGMSSGGMFGGGMQGRGIPGGGGIPGGSDWNPPIANYPPPLGVPYSAPNKGMPQSGDPLASLQNEHHHLDHGRHGYTIMVKLIILGTSAFVLIVLAGTWCNIKYSHRSGADAIPFIKFWREVPALCQDCAGAGRKAFAGIINFGHWCVAPFFRSSGGTPSAFPSRGGYTTL